MKIIERSSRRDHSCFEIFTTELCAMPLSLSDYSYELPDELIAQHPLAVRDEARLLVYKSGTISHSTFREARQFLPSECVLVFNDTQVVHARLFFTRESGSVIEVFCLKPVSPHAEMSQAMQVKGSTVWECMIGNAKKWKEGLVLEKKLGNETVLKANLLSREGRFARVQFSWEPEEITWSVILEKAGRIPLPPYIHRDPEASDSSEYQTVYARHEGAVAAPTAGLHFTDGLIREMEEKGMEAASVTLHVSAGTFQPIENENVLEHPMHNEQVVVSRETIEKLARNEKVIAIGTTSARTLESLYWFGHKILASPASEEFFIEKLYPYDFLDKTLPTLKESMSAILNWMEKRGLQQVWGRTEIFIFPGYRFQVCKGLFTNFHLSQSTLILLVAAMIGDGWREVYEEAIREKYRFLSYGDGSLLIP
jgi:S-adenosylmethionine:tRNA ribosyltransferase-isomerase